MQTLQQHSCYDCKHSVEVCLPDGRWVIGCVTTEDEHRRNRRRLDVECIGRPETGCDEWEEER